MSCFYHALYLRYSGSIHSAFCCDKLQYLTNCAYCNLLLLEPLILDIQFYWIFYTFTWNFKNNYRNIFYVNGLKFSIKFSIYSFVKQHGKWDCQFIKDNKDINSVMVYTCLLLKGTLETIVEKYFMLIAQNSLWNFQSILLLQKHKRQLLWQSTFHTVQWY